MFKWLTLLQTFISILLVNGKDRSCGQIYLTLAAKTKNIVFNWEFSCKTHPDTLVLVKKLSLKRMYVEVKRIKILYGNRIGRQDSNYTFEFESFPGRWNDYDKMPPTTKRCFPYYILAYTGKKIVNKRCLSIEPDWMKNFGHLRVGQMFIPGSFRSNSVELQGFDLWGQLVFGVRYFDLIVGRGTTKNLGTRNILEKLKQIPDFFKKAKKEIVILDFHGFYNFTESTHDALVYFLEKNLKRFAARPEMASHVLGPKLSHMWSLNRRIIINYRHKIVTKKNNWLWNSILLKTTNSSSVSDLRTLIETQADDHHHKEIACALVAVTNGDSEDKTPKMINDQVWKFLTRKRLLKHINILVVNFFYNTTIISDAIAANKKKKKRLMSRPLGITNKNK